MTGMKSMQLMIVSSRMQRQERQRDGPDSRWSMARGVGHIEDNTIIQEQRHSDILSAFA